MAKSKGVKPAKAERTAAPVAPSATIARTRAEIVGEMCNRIGAGESLSAVLRAGERDYPASRTFWSWLAADPALVVIYEAALAQRAHVYAEELIEIADDACLDVVDGENGPRPNPEAVARAKLRVNTRQWIMSRLLPKKYGDRLTQEITGKDGTPLGLIVLPAKSEGV